MTIQEIYAEIGEDYNDILERFENEWMIVKYATRFLGLNIYEQLMDAIESKDYEKVFTTSHDMKGLCANMSFTRLQKLVSDICEQVRDGAPKVDLIPMAGAATAEYERIMKSLRKLDV